MNFYIETLGCARNKVDSEVIKRELLKLNFYISKNPYKAEIIIINTCSFIEKAINESIDSILELSKLKNDGICNILIVTGCLPSRFNQKLAKNIPEVDFFLNNKEFNKIGNILEKTFKTLGDSSLISQNFKKNLKKPKLYSRNITSNTAYLKISEGCDKNCSYCILPKIKGKQKSRTLQEIISDAKKLIDYGVKEINLVAQDSTYYGYDLYGKSSLNVLLRNLAKLSKNVWIRFLYGHPESITKKTIETIASYDNLCPYFDIPIQHVSKKILKNMSRNYQKKELISMFKNIRGIIPNATIRTTIIVGFPGENESNYKELIDFIELMKFDNLGVFEYSDQNDLASHYLKNHIDYNLVRTRHKLIMSKQLKISQNKLLRFIDKIVNVLIESSLESNLYEGRTINQAPEVDGITYIHTPKNSICKIGSILPVKITDSLEYDLIGKIYT